MKPKTIDIELSTPQLTFTNMRCKFPLFVAGYGAGKTGTMCINGIIATSWYPGGVYVVYEPTYRLIDSVARPEMDKWLDVFQIRHAYNKASAKYTLQNDAEIWFVSMEDVAAIVGYQATAGSAIDEIEQLPYDKQIDVFGRVIARIRGPKPHGAPAPQCRVYTTPDHGTAGITWQRWGINSTLSASEQAKRTPYQYVTADSESNPHTGPDYIENLKNTYFGKAADVYIHGKWVNLTNGLVYTEYDRAACRSNETVTAAERSLFVGMDFNVGHMAAIVNIRRPNPNKGSPSIYQYHAVREFTELSDTPSMITRLKQEYPTQKITIYPDCAGVSRKSVDASISDITLLQQAGFTCYYHPAHPAVKDRVLAMNRALHSRDLLVNDDLCPTLAKSLSEQAYDDKGEPSKTLGIDHPLDAQGYLVEYEMPIRGKQIEMIPTYGRF